MNIIWQRSHKKRLTIKLTGRVVKPGRTLTVCSGDVLAVDEGAEQIVATMLATMMKLLEKEDFSE